MAHTQPRFRALYSAMLGCFVLFGVTLTMIGATLPKIIHGFRWSYTATGLVLSSGSLAYFVTTFISGILVQRLGPKRVLVAGLAIQGLGLAFFAACPFVLLNLLLCVLMGVGHGGIEVVVNFSVVRMERPGQSRLMSLTHAAFSVGAILGPFLLAGLLEVGAGWQVVYRLMAGVSFGAAGAVGLLSFAGVAGGPQRTSEEDPRVLDLLRRPLLILLFLTLLLYVGSELGVSHWLAEYYERVLHSSAFRAQLMPSVLWAGVLLGRVAVSFGYRGSRQAEVLVVLACLCTVSLAVAIVIGDAVGAGVGFFVTGLGYSAVYPLVMVLVGRHFQRGQSVAIGFASTGGGVGCFAMPFVMAAISDHFGLRAGFLFYLSLCVMMTGVTFAILRLVRAMPEQTSV